MDEKKQYPVCCFTGHRQKGFPYPLQGEDERYLALRRLIRAQIEELILHRSCRHFICGMAEGFDLTAGLEAALAKRRYAKLGITLEAAIPFPEQTKSWSERLRVRYETVLAECDQKTVVCPSYSRGVYQIRNRYMVDRSDIVLAAWNGEPSGTGSTVRYALSKDIPVILIDPAAIGLTADPLHTGAERS